MQNTKLTKASLRSSSVTAAIFLGMSNCIIYLKFLETLQILEICQLYKPAVSSVAKRTLSVREVE